MVALWLHCGWGVDWRVIWIRELKCMLCVLDQLRDYEMQNILKFILFADDTNLFVASNSRSI